MLPSIQVINAPFHAFRSRALRFRSHGFRPRAASRRAAHRTSRAARYGSPRRPCKAPRHPARAETDIAPGRATRNPPVIGQDGSCDPSASAKARDNRNDSASGTGRVASHACGLAQARRHDGLGAPGTDGRFRASDEHG